jgi:hypothetical protein
VWVRKIAISGEAWEAARERADLSWTEVSARLDDAAYKTVYRWRRDGLTPANRIASVLEVLPTLEIPQASLTPDDEAQIARLDWLTGFRDEMRERLEAIDEQLRDMTMPSRTGTNPRAVSGAGARTRKQAG